MPNHRRRSSLFVALALAASGLSAAPFADVPARHWAAEDAAWLKQQGLLEGWDGKLHGKRGFTRYEMVKVLARYLRRSEAARAAIEKRLSKVEANDRLQDARIAKLFDTSGGDARLTVPDLARATEMAREQQKAGRGARAPERTREPARRHLPTGTPDPEGEATDLRMSARMAVLRARLRSVRSEGLETPMLIVPPGSVAEVSLPQVLLDERPAKLGEGSHLVQWESRIEVPTGSSASVVYPGGTGGYVLLEGTSAVTRRRGLDRLAGNVLPVARGGGLPRVLD